MCNLKTTEIRTVVTCVEITFDGGISAAVPGCSIFDCSPGVAKLRSLMDARYMQFLFGHCF